MAYTLDVGEHYGEITLKITYSHISTLYLETVPHKFSICMLHHIDIAIAIQANYNYEHPQLTINYRYVHVYMHLRLKR